MNRPHHTHEKKDFKQDKIFTYERNEKLFTAFVLISVGIIIAILILFYIFAWRHSDNVVITTLAQGISHITTQISDATLLGVFYGSLIGGLFFVFVPTEALFISFLRAHHNPILLIIIYISGFILSYSLNYFVGLKLNRVAKKAIGPKKFYSTKGIMNRYGSLGVFGFNALPLPSQPLATILGVFKYNKGRFYILFISGQLAKYIVISFIFSFLI